MCAPIFHPHFSIYLQLDFTLSCLRKLIFLEEVGFSPKILLFLFLQQSKARNLDLLGVLSYPPLQPSANFNRRQCTLIQSRAVTQAINKHLTFKDKLTANILSISHLFFLISLTRVIIARHEKEKILKCK